MSLGFLSHRSPIYAVILIVCGALPNLSLRALGADGNQPIDSDWTLVAPNKGWWKEVQIPIGYRVWLGGFGGPGIYLTIIDDTNVGLHFRVDNAPVCYLEKHKGLVTVDPRSVLTRVYPYGDHPVYYVDDLKAHNGYAKLRIEAP